MICRYVQGRPVAEPGTGTFPKTIAGLSTPASLYVLDRTCDERVCNSTTHDTTGVCSLALHAGTTDCGSTSSLRSRRNHRLGVDKRGWFEMVFPRLHHRFRRGFSRSIPHYRSVLGLKVSWVASKLTDMLEVCAFHDCRGFSYLGAFKRCGWAFLPVSGLSSNVSNSVIRVPLIQARWDGATIPRYRRTARRLPASSTLGTAYGPRLGQGSCSPEPWGVALLTCVLVYLRENPENPNQR